MFQRKLRLVIGVSAFVVSLLNFGIVLLPIGDNKNHVAIVSERKVTIIATFSPAVHAVLAKLRQAVNSSLSATTAPQLDHPPLPSSFCAPTTQLAVLQISTTTTSTTTSNKGSARWEIQSFDENQRPKNMGGDEYYVRYTDANWRNTTLVAHVKDLQNGRYELDFVSVNETIHTGNLTSSPNNGRLDIILQYTCNIGSMYPPTKDSWKTGGFINYLWSTPVTRPPFRTFVPPPSQKFGKYDYIALYGDSTTGQWVGQYRANAKKFPKNIHWKKNPRADLCTKNLDYHFNLFQSLFDFRLSEHNNTAIVIGSALWDIVWSSVENDPTFSDHLEAVERFVTGLLKMYPDSDFFWKSTTAAHIHHIANATTDVDENALYRATKYLSGKRVKFLHEAQRDLMVSLNVSYLDIYESSFLNADWSKPGDAIHFRPPFNKRMIEWFYAP